MSAEDRQHAVTRLAIMLTEAAGAAATEQNNNGWRFSPPAILQRKAVVYVRQSTQARVDFNTESRRRQFGLVEFVRRHGFRAVEVIDDDLGRSACAMVAPPGFEKLVAALCAGEIDAVLCFKASRLARNGRDWHHLLELCGLVEARVIDLDGIYATPVGQTNGCCWA